MKGIFDPHNLFVTYEWMLHFHMFSNSDPNKNRALVG
jgi:hypothetical protein